MSSQKAKGDVKAQYDEKAKETLANKNVLAQILVHTVDQYKEFDPKEVVTMIEGEPFIGVVPIDPGHTNMEKMVNGEKIVGLNTENFAENEGLARFDIIFYVRRPDGLDQILINVEAQKDGHPGYPLMNRAIFYVSRQIGSQKERDFKHSDYGKIKRCYSIWVCMNMDQNSLNHIHLKNDVILGDQKWSGDIDLINIFLIGITNELPDQEEKQELHRLLCALFSKDLSKEEKDQVVEGEYDIHDPALQKGMMEMCNLSNAIDEKSRAEERTEIVNEMIQQGLSDEMILKCTKISKEELKQIKKSNC